MPESSTAASDLRLRSTFFRSVTLLTSSAGIILCGSEGLLFPSALTPVFAIIGWTLVDQLRWLRVPVFAGNTLGLIALGAATSEFVGGTLEQKLLSGSHLIAYLTWIVLLMPKGHRQYWWLIALSVLQLAVSGVLSTGAGFGAAMLSMLLLLLWTMSVFSLFRVQDLHAKRKADPMSGQSGILVHDGLQQDPAEVWVGWRFRWMVVGSYVVSLVLALFVFAAFPRVWVPGGVLFGTAESASESLRYRSGFSENVELGQVGELMLSNARVLTFSIADVKTGKAVPAEEFAKAMNMDEIRFRGNAMGHYRAGKWSRGYAGRGQLRTDPDTNAFGDQLVLEKNFRLALTQDPPFGEFAFAPYPVSGASTSPPFRIHQRQISGALIWGRGFEATTHAPRSFVVECPRLDTNPEVTFEFWGIPEDSSAELRVELEKQLDDFVRPLFITQNLSRELPRLYRLARETCTVNGILVQKDQRVERIVDYLSNANGFAYSLAQTRQDRSLDPVEDFLLNSKAGHCEYFASACALMLQAVDVPARLVNGYYGSEVNTLTGSYEVRQRHAHAWVEVFLNHRWQTLEPTPSAERRTSVSESRQASLMSNIQAAISDLWNDGIYRMSAERQKQFFAPVISTSKSLWESIRQQGLWNTIKTSFRNFLTSPSSWFSWQGGIVTFVLLLTCAALNRIKVLHRLLSLIRSIRNKLSRQHRTAESVIRFYARFCSLCERHGLKCPPANSALENGRAAVRRFEEGLDSPELKYVPLRIAQAFNEVRFGSVTLSDDDAASIGRDLQLLSEALKLSARIN